MTALNLTALAVIRRYGLLAVFAVTFIEGEAVLLTAGYILEETVMQIFHGWLAWVWLGLSISAVILFFRHLERILSRKKLK